MSEPVVRVPLATQDREIGREVVLAEPLSGQNEYRIRSIPAFVYGLAPGDEVRVLDKKSGEFEVLARGKNVAVRVFVEGGLERPDIRALIQEVERAGGEFEIARNDTRLGGASLLLLSIDSRRGFPAIETMMHLIEGSDVKWEYGNVYDDAGRPLNWWLQ